MVGLDGVKALACSVAFAVAACVGSRPSSDATLAEAKVLIEARSYPEALALLDQCLASDPDDLAALREHAFVEVELRNLPEARTDLVRAIRLAPDSAWSHYKLGFVLFLLGEPDEAIVRHTRAIELDPTFMMAFQNRAWLRQERGEFEAAVADYTRAMELLPADDPLRRDCLWSRSQCYFRLGKESEGKRDQDEFYATSRG